VHEFVKVSLRVHRNKRLKSTALLYTTYSRQGCGVGVTRTLEVNVGVGCFYVFIRLRKSNWAIFTSHS